MKFNFKKKKETHQENEEFDKLGFTKSELIEYDKSVDFYYTNIINSLILFTYSSEKLEEMTPILINPLVELYEELEYAFTPVCFETVFRNNLIDDKFKEELFTFKKEVDKIPNEIWDWQFLNEHEIWLRTRNNADKILNIIGINHRNYNDDYTTVYSSNGEIIKKGGNNFK